MDDGSSSRPVDIYGDFNCPYSALASARLSRLESLVTAPFEWRCVEHDPAISTLGGPLSGEQRAEYETELAQVRGLLADDEVDRLRVPARQLNTNALNMLYADTPLDQRSALRTALFDAYWRDDQDLTDNTVLTEIVGRVAWGYPSAGDGSVASDGRTWQQQWRDFDEPIVPMLVLPGDTQLRGLDALDALGRWLASPSELHAELPAT